jgi:hypothetical protein
MASGGRGDRATAQVLTVLAAKREGLGYAGPWPEATVPAGAGQSYFTQLPSDCFASVRLAPPDLC